jgi:hypothetical protein
MSEDEGIVTNPDLSTIDVGQSYIESDPTQRALEIRALVTRLTADIHADPDPSADATMKLKPGTNYHAYIRMPDIRRTLQILATSQEGDMSDIATVWDLIDRLHLKAVDSRNQQELVLPGEMNIDRITLQEITKAQETLSKPLTNATLDTVNFGDDSWNNLRVIVSNRFTPFQQEVIQQFDEAPVEAKAA